MKTDDSLWAAYESTTYLAHTDVGEIRIHPGRRSTQLSKLLHAHGATDWAFITAYNPGSIQHSAALNKRARARLIRAIRRLRLRYWLADGVAADPRWTPEPSLLVLGLDEQRARRLGKRFGQVAIVVGVGRRPARVVRCAGPAQDIVAKFSYRVTPNEMGGDGEECSLFLDSANGKRVGRRDSRQLACEFLLDNVPRRLLDDKRLAGRLEWSSETPVNIAAVVAKRAAGFETLQEVLHGAGFSGLIFRAR